MRLLNSHRALDAAAAQQVLLEYTHKRKQKKTKNSVCVCVCVVKAVLRTEVPTWLACVCAKLIPISHTHTQMVGGDERRNIKYALGKVTDIYTPGVFHSFSGRSHLI